MTEKGSQRWMFHTIQELKPNFQYDFFMKKYYVEFDFNFYHLQNYETMSTFPCLVRFHPSMVILC